jgi:hypothetical protein
MHHVGGVGLCANAPAIAKDSHVYYAAPPRLARFTLDPFG